jgi:hypothetical protein
VAGEHNPLGSDLGQSDAAVMAILPETSRNKQAADHEEQYDSASKDGGHAEQVTCVFQISHR